jgi:hypothetical protein
MKNAFKLAAVVFLFTLHAPDAFACSCADPSVRRKFRDADAVFVGEVVEMSSFGPNDDFPLATNLAKFKVERHWKGSNESEITTVVNFDSPGMCGDLKLAVGERFLIYAERKKGRLLIQTDCGPNRNLKYAGEELKKLNSFRFRLFARFYPYPKF